MAQLVQASGNVVSMLEQRLREAAMRSRESADATRTLAKDPFGDKIDPTTRSARSEALTPCSWLHSAWQPPLVSQGEPVRSTASFSSPRHVPDVLPP